MSGGRPERSRSGRCAPRPRSRDPRRRMECRGWRLPRPHGGSAAPGPRRRRSRACGPVGGGCDVGRGTGEPAQGIFPVSRMVADAGNHFGMRRLEDEGAYPTDKSRHIGKHRPRHRSRSQQAGIVRVVEGVLEGIGGMSERRGRRGRDSLPQALQTATKRCRNLQDGPIINPLNSKLTGPYCRWRDREQRDVSGDER